MQRTRENVLYTPSGTIHFERLPHELLCSDGAQTSTNVSGRAFRVGVLSVLPESARTKRYVRKETKMSQFTYKSSSRKHVQKRVEFAQRGLFVYLVCGFLLSGNVYE